MRRAVLTLAAAIGLGFVAPATAADKHLVIDVWPGKAPGENGEVGEEKITTNKPGEKPFKSITNVTHPTLTVYRPAKDHDTGAAVVVAPGGGYNNLAYDKEGEEVAEWLNTLGVTGLVLKYRVPRRPGDPKDKPPVQALMDAQRALSLARGKAKDWGIDPKRVGMLGFSAGGHLTAWAATNFDKRSYEPIDDVDKESCRPDFAVMVYPGGVVQKDKDELSPEIRVTKETPPSFFAHANDDAVSSRNSVVMYLALKKEKVPAEMHIFASGGHGFGLRKSDKPCSHWPERCAEWMQAQGFLKTNVAAGK